MRIVRLVLTLAIVLSVVAGVGAWAWKLSKPVPDVIQGQVEATLVNVSAKIPGRVATLAVREGAGVERGQLLVTLESPEIDAKLAQAEAARQAAAAQRDKANHGAREEEIRQARVMWERAQHATELAEKTYQRIDRLNRDGVLPAQRKDEAEAQWKTSRDAGEAARAAYDMALSGARTEDKQSAEALVSRAKGAIAEVEAYVGETTLRAPLSGEVYKRNVEPGEMVAAGYPILTILDPTDVWMTFQVREDRLGEASMGGQVVVRVPALGGRTVELQIFYIAPVGEFATWRATNAQGGFDLKTFEVRARPNQRVPGLRPGMSVLVDKGL
jgi:HlyD family secretion protein